MTEVLFLETAQYEENLREQGERRLNVSGVLRILGVSRSGYLSWKKRLPSDRERRKESLKEKILAIYEESHQNYGAPCSTAGSSLKTSIIFCIICSSESEKVTTIIFPCHHSIISCPKHIILHCHFLKHLPCCNSSSVFRQYNKPGQQIRK